MVTCHICGVALPNKWAVARREMIDGEERCYCHLHANADFNGKLAKKTPAAKGANMDEPKRTAPAAREQEIVEQASGERAKSAWRECASLAGKLGGGIKAIGLGYPVGWCVCAVAMAVYYAVKKRELLPE